MPGGRAKEEDVLAIRLPKSGVGLNVIAFDGDGVLWEPTYPSPSIGAPVQKAVDAAYAYRDLGYECIIFTARPHDHRPLIQRWLREHGLEDLFYTIVTGKPRYALLWDDRAREWPEAFGS